MSTVIENFDMAELLLGKTRYFILALLLGHPDDLYYLRQIERITGSGLGAVQRELRLLNEIGILSRTVNGRQVYYQANKNFKYFKELRTLTSEA